MRFHDLIKREDVNFSQCDSNEALLNDIDNKAKIKGELLWRYIQEPFADGYAIYQIIKVNKKTVRIEHIRLGGDDWGVPYWGQETSIPIAFAIQNIGWRDSLAELFKGGDNE